LEARAPERNERGRCRASKRAISASKSKKAKGANAPFAPPCSGAPDWRSVFL